MTKQELITAILNDMDERQDTSRHEIEKRWKGWLTRQTKAELETIYSIRTRKN